MRYAWTCVGIGVRYVVALAAIEFRHGRAWLHQRVPSAGARRALAGIVAVLAVGVSYTTLSSANVAGPPYAVHHFTVHAAGAVAVPTTTATTAIAAGPSTSGVPEVDPGGAVVVPSETMVATVHGDTAYSSTAGSSAPVVGTIPGTWHGAPSALPVIARAAGYDEVRLAQRPNESTGWVDDKSVTITTDPYFIVVDLFTTKLTVYRSGAQVGQYPVGVGTSADPTPTGNYFVAFAANPPGAGYGPMVLATSAHSDVIQDWSSSGDALIAIHGPLGSDGAIGSQGAHVTHGCIRMHVSDQRQLAGVPGGTPVVIVA